MLVGCPPQPNYRVVSLILKLFRTNSLLDTITFIIFYFEYMCVCGAGGGVDRLCLLESRNCSYNNMVYFVIKDNMVLLEKNITVKVSKGPQHNYRC